MYENRNRARKILELGNHTCVLCCTEETITDDRRGIRPLLEFLEKKRCWQEFCAADKVVGKAAAFLYRLMGIQALYAHVVSEPAAQVLRDGGIDLEYGTLVPAIRNRDNTGYCPMEATVWNISDPREALTALQKALG